MRVPSPRLSALLAALMLGLGAAVGAAFGPAPEPSLAGVPADLAQRLPLLIAALEHRPATTPASPTSETSASESGGHVRRRRHHRKQAAAPHAATTSEPTSASEQPSEGAKQETTGEAGRQTALPPVSAVWLIELSGSGFPAALADQAAAPTIGQAVGQGTLLSEWSALDASAFASEAALLEPPAATGPPPVMRTIVQPPCPEGAAGAGCAAETPGALTAADGFLKATLATITSTPAYTAHGLVLITFTQVGLPAQAGLPEGASSATLTYKPPAGALLLSPFAKAGRRSAAGYEPTAPRKSAEKLLHK